MAENSFNKYILLFFTFFTLAPITLLISIFVLLTVSHNKASTQVLAEKEENLISTPRAGVQVYASLPNTIPSIKAETKSADARIKIIQNYLSRYNSPLLPYAEILVYEAEKNGLDFRLTTAIAQQESNLCKKIPAESYNCWGWGIHSKGTLAFANYKEAIETVSEGIKKEYINKGLFTVDDIMSKYTPLSPGSWAEGVTKFMKEME
jgi:hypothetical protein